MDIPEMILVKRTRTFTGYDSLSPGCCCIKAWKRLRDAHISSTLKEIDGMKREEYKPFMRLQFEAEEEGKKLGWKISLGVLAFMVLFIAVGVYFQ